MAGDKERTEMIVVASTVAAYKCNGAEELSWLANAEAMMADYPELHFFCAIQVGQGRDNAFGPLRRRLSELPSTVWTFAIDDGAREISSSNRLLYIATGRNLAIEFGMRTRATHILFLDTDLTPPGDCLSKLLAVDHPIVGGTVPHYGLRGQAVEGYPFPVEEHWNTAGFLLIRREVFRRVRWRTDPDAGMSDDPCYAADAEQLGFGKTRVRKDVIGLHPPLMPLEKRGQNLHIQQ